MCSACVTSSTVETPSGSRIRALRVAFSIVLRDAPSTQRTSTPKSRSAATRIASPSPGLKRGGVPPPVTSSGRPVRRWRCTPCLSRASVAGPIVASPYSGATAR
jgi:hypothetical protein